MPLKALYCTISLFGLGFRNSYQERAHTEHPSDSGAAMSLSALKALHRLIPPFGPFELASFL